MDLGGCQIAVPASQPESRGVDCAEATEPAMIATIVQQIAKFVLGKRLRPFMFDFQCKPVFRSPDSESSSARKVRRRAQNPRVNSRRTSNCLTIPFLSNLESENLATRSEPIAVASLPHPRLADAELKTFVSCTKLLRLCGRKNICNSVAVV